MELNAEQIIKDLECCRFGKDEAKCKECNWHPWIKPRCWRLLASNALALIKELTEENERLRAEDVIRLPLKVGDIVYSYTRFWRKEDGISPYQITNITITQNKKGIWTKKYRAMRMLSGRKIDDQLNFAFDEIGKTVFLTLIEADQIAKEILEGNNDNT